MNGIEFVSDNGNRYVYDDNSGQIFPLYNRRAEVVLREYREKMGKGIELPIEKIKAKDVEEYCVNEGHGFRQLILNVTDECNFRCKYCCYSNHYSYTREYSGKKMNKKTAEKAIDLYFSYVEEVKKINPLMETFVGFYGGEPLLNFDVVKHAVEYIKLKYKDYKVGYNITTNGYLLDSRTADFLVDNNFSILVSIDGDEKNHDRNRVTIDGKGTFDRIYSNVEMLLKRYPGYPLISASACFDLKTNIFEAEEFFEQSCISPIRYSMVDQTCTTYYNNFTVMDSDNFKMQMDLVWEKIIRLAEKGEFNGERFLFRAFGIGFLELSYHSMIGDTKNRLIPYTGCCIPGEKIMVGSDGRFHICERINQFFPIGDVDNGIDYTAIARYINEYNQIVCINCSDCPVKRLCNFCFTKFSKNGHFEYDSTICASFINSLEKSLSKYMSLLERDPTFVEELTVKYYEYIVNKKIGGC